jgi:hypothetical protein
LRSADRVGEAPDLGRHEHLEDVVAHLVGGHVGVGAEVGERHAVAVAEEEGGREGVVEGVVVLAAVALAQVRVAHDRRGEGREAVRHAELARAREGPVDAGLHEARVARWEDEVELRPEGGRRHEVEDTGEVAGQAARAVERVEHDRARSGRLHGVRVEYRSRARDGGQAVHEQEQLAAARVHGRLEAREGHE